MDSKKCCACGDTKPIEEFHLAGFSISGGRQYRSKCKPCYSRHLAQQKRDMELYPSANLEDRVAKAAFIVENLGLTRERVRGWFQRRGFVYEND